MREGNGPSAVTLMQLGRTGAEAWTPADVVECAETREARWAAGTRSTFQAQAECAGAHEGRGCVVHQGRGEVAIGAAGDDDRVLAPVVHAGQGRTGGDDETWTREASTPALRRDSSRIAPFASPPTAPTMDALAPSGAATTAWFADLPTGRTWRGPPVTVFPRRGWSGTDQEVRDALVHGEPTVRPHLGDQGPRWCGPRTGAVWSASQRGTSFGWADRTGEVWTVHSL